MLLSISNASFIISFVLLFFLNKTNRANIYLILFRELKKLFSKSEHQENTAIQPK